MPQRIYRGERPVRVRLDVRPHQLAYGCSDSGRFHGKRDRRRRTRSPRTQVLSPEDELMVLMRGRYHFSGVPERFSRVVRLQVTERVGDIKATRGTLIGESTVVHVRTNGVRESGDRGQIALARRSDGGAAEGRQQDVLRQHPLPERGGKSRRRQLDVPTIEEQLRDVGQASGFGGWIAPHVFICGPAVPQRLIHVTSGDRSVHQRLMTERGESRQPMGPPESHGTIRVCA